MKYFVSDHHNFWQHEMGNVDNIEDADVVFIWADWPYEREIKILQSLGKKVICFEHGYCSFHDYVNNNKTPCSDGYLSIGRHSKVMLKRAGVNPDDILISGNLSFTNVPKRKGTHGKKALCPALHWFSDLTDYNTDTFIKLRESYPDFEWTVKLNSKSGFDKSILNGENVWESDLETDFIQDIKENISKYDMVFTPRFSTFEMFATLADVPVYCIDKQASYRSENDPMPNDIDGKTFITIGDRLPRTNKIHLNYEIRKDALHLDKILEWVDGRYF